MVYHDISQEQLLLLITQAVQAELQKRSRQVPVGISVRHIHLTRDDVDKLFGYGYQLTPKKALSQPGQFACEECLDIIGPKGELKHVRILGPERSATQIELAQTDCRNIGIKAPVRSSGDTKGTPGVTLRGPNGTLTVPEGVMIADRHIHIGSKTKKDRRGRAADNGRGLFSFLFIYAGSYLSLHLHALIPASPAPLQGVQGALTIYGNLHSLLLPLCTAGIFICILRRFAVR